MSANRYTLAQAGLFALTGAVLTAAMLVLLSRLIHLGIPTRTPANSPVTVHGGAMTIRSYAQFTQVDNETVCVPFYVAGRTPQLTHSNLGGAVDMTHVLASGSQVDFFVRKKDGKSVNDTDEVRALIKGGCNNGVGIFFSVKNGKFYDYDSGFQDDDNTHIRRFDPGTCDPIKPDTTGDADMCNRIARIYFPDSSGGEVTDQKQIQKSPSWPCD